MTLKKHIVCTVTNDLTYDRRMQRICTALAQAGYHVTLVGRQLKSSTTFQPELFETKRIRCFSNKGFLFYKEYNIRLFFYLLRLRFDIACACDLDTALPVLWSAAIKRKKSVYDAHEYFSEVPELSHRPLVKKVWEFIGRISIHRFHARYTVGEALAKLMGDQYHVHFKVIRNIAPSKHLSVYDSDRFFNKVILYQGALNVGRGLFACIDVIKQLPDWKLWLAGEGDITEELKQKVKRDQLDESVVFFGWVKPAELPSLMAQATISINLRERGSLNDYYSLPNKFFDAIHAGLPSIHMDYPEYKNIIAQYPCAFLVEEVNVQKIVDTVNYLVEHPKAWEEMVVACKSAAKEYTWENESKKLLQVYQALS